MKLVLRPEDRTDLERTLRGSIFASGGIKAAARPLNADLLRLEGGGAAGELPEKRPPENGLPENGPPGIGLSANGWSASGQAAAGAVGRMPATAWRLPGFTRPTRLSRPEWLLRGFDLLARSGHPALSFAILCDCPGGSRAGFFGFFADMGEYRRELIALWEVACSNPVSAAAGPALARLLELADEAAAEGVGVGDAGIGAEYVAVGVDALTGGPEVMAREPEGAAIERAIRDWARGDVMVAAALARVDAWRLAELQGLLVDAGLSHRRAAERAAVFYAARLGFDRLRETTDVMAVAPMRALALAILGGKQAQ